MTARSNSVVEPNILYGSPLIKYLDTVGDGTGNKLAIGDYSTNPTAFYLKPATGTVYVINMFIIHLTGTGQFKHDTYGPISELPNGLLITAGRGNIDTLDILDGLPIKSNRHFTRLTSSVTLIKWDGEPASSLVCSYKATDFGTNLMLDGTEGDYLKVLCRDNFTGLTGQRFGAFGFINHN